MARTTVGLVADAVWRSIAVGGLGVLAGWGVSLGAWLATGCTLALALAIARRWPARRAGLLVLAIGTLGAVETLWRIDRIGARARAGPLGLRDQVAVYGFNVAFGLAAIPAGFREFGFETLALGVPWSDAGACPPERLAQYAGLVPSVGGRAPRLRRWSSSLPLRSPRIRRRLARWAAALPSPTPGATAQGGPWRLRPWSWRTYLAADSPNRVPVALNTPMTRLSVVARAEEGRWRMTGTVDLPIAYPEQASLQIGPFTLEEGLWHDSRALLRPYCLEHTFAVWADDPRLDDPTPQRGPFERASTAVLRALGAHYR